MREISSPGLASRTTLRLGGTAIAELILDGPEDFAVLPERLHALGGTPLVLGAGSNILAQDGGLPLVLVRPNFTAGPEIIGCNGQRTLVRAGAGVPLPRLLRFCAQQGLTGLEGLAGSPGSVGGAVAMNAGSFGVQTCEKIEFIEVFSQGCIHRITVDGLQFGYRTLSLAGKNQDFIVVAATFGLTEATRDGITNLMRHNFFEKKSRQPVTAWSAGFRGKKLGGMAFSEMHANFLINEGRGEAEAALTLLREARDAVRSRFGIVLEPEVRIVPCLSL